MDVSYGSKDPYETHGWTTKCRRNSVNYSKKITSWKEVYLADESISFQEGQRSMLIPILLC
jgi:hypothetical protein